MKKEYINLFLWITGILLVGSLLGSLTKPEINNWYLSLNRSSLNPPNYVFPIAWTLLYILIGITGWKIWQKDSTLLKGFYSFQLFLNWIWTPLFFYYQLIGCALFGLILLDLIVFSLICFSYSKIKLIVWLMLPYFFWLLFATYLNFYIWKYN